MSADAPDVGGGPASATVTGVAMDGVRAPAHETSALRGVANTAFADRLGAAAAIDVRFHLLVVFSCAIATFGLIADSPAVVVGAMLVAPLLTPIMALALGSVGGRFRLLATAGPALLEGILV